jgi:hypothetical protein
MITVNSWVGAGNEEAGLALATDGTYIYAYVAYDADSVTSVILKLDPSDMSELARYECDDIQEVFKMVCDGGYLYVTYPSALLKIDTSDMTLNSTFPYNASGPGIVILGGYIYAIYEFSLVKIDPADMSTPVDVLYPFGYYQLATDGTYIYACSMDDPEVVKVDPSTMSIVDAWDGSGDWEYTVDVTYGGGYIFVATVNETAETTGVVKIDPSDMSTAGTFDIPGNFFPAVVLYDNSAVYVSSHWFNGSPAYVYKIDPATMTTADYWTGSLTSEGAMGVIWLSPYLYASLYSSPAEVDQLSEAAGYSLTVNTSGSGSVTKDPDQGSYLDGTPVELTAVPADGWAFDHWSGDLTGDTNPDTITMDDDKEVTAHFVPLYAYSLTISIDGLGTVTKNPDQDTYDPGEVVELTAVPGDSWFKEWQGDASGSSNPTNVTMSGNKAVTAVFSRDNVVKTYSTTRKQARELYYDGTLLWVGFYENPMYVYKLSTGALTQQGTWGGYSVRKYCTGVKGDGTYIYVLSRTDGTAYDKPKVGQMNPSTMALVDGWTGAGFGGGDGGNQYIGECLDVFGGWVYCGSGLSQGELTKINPSGMNTDSYWVATSGYGSVHALCNDGTYIYAGLARANVAMPPRIYKINPATMSPVAVCDDQPDVSRGVSALYHDGTYLYAVVLDGSGVVFENLQVLKIDPATMTTLAVWTPTDSSMVQAYDITKMGDYLYLPIYQGYVLKIDPDTMTTVDTWEAETGQEDNWSLTNDGTFLYCGLDKTGSLRVLKLFIPASYGFPHSQAGLVW